MKINNVWLGFKLKLKRNSEFRTTVKLVFLFTICYPTILFVSSKLYPSDIPIVLLLIASFVELFILLGIYLIVSGILQKIWKFLKGLEEIGASEKKEFLRKLKS